MNPLVSICNFAAGTYSELLRLAKKRVHKDKATKDSDQKEDDPKPIGLVVEIYGLWLGHKRAVAPVTCSANCQVLAKNSRSPYPSEFIVTY